MARRTHRQMRSSLRSARWNSARFYAPRPYGYYGGPGYYGGGPGVNFSFGSGGYRGW